MLVTIKIGAIIVAIMFYLTAKNLGENRFKWAITGLIGYVLTFFIAMMLIGEPVVSMALGLLTCVMARKMLLRMAVKEKHLFD